MSKKYQHLLSPLKIGRRVIKNRMTAGNFKKHFIQGPEEYPTENVITHFVNKARNGAAIVCFPGIEFESRKVPDHYMPPYNVGENLNQHYVCQVADGCHLFNALCIAPLHLKLPMVGPGMSGNETEMDFYDVSDGVLSMYIMGDPMCEKFGRHYSQPYTREMIGEAVRTAVEQAKALQELGIDGVHVSNTRFLSPLTNKRKDEYGGSLENRLRMIRDLCRGIKEACGSDFLVETVISVPEAEEGGWTLEDAIQACILLEGCADIVNVWGDEIDERHVTQFQPVTPYLDAVAAIKAGLKDREHPVVLQTMGGYQNPEVMEEAIAQGKTDLISMARAFIADPEYGKKLYEGRADDIVPCLRCNKCHRTGGKDPWIDACSVNPVWSYEHKIERLFDAPGGVRRVAVIGGGPAGMKVSILLRERGHQVTLYERTGRLGGLLNTSEQVSFKWPLRNFKSYLIRQVEKRDRITVRLNTPVTPAQVEAEQFDAVVAALGAAPALPPIPGLEPGSFLFATEALEHTDRLGRNVVIIGGGEVGVETGMHAAQQGRKATVLEMRDMLAADSTKIHYRSMFREAWEAEPNFTGIVNARVTAVDADGVRYVDPEGAEHVVPADTVVVSAGMKAKTDEALAFYGTAPEFYMTGDCERAATVQQAMRSAFAVAHKI